IDHVDVAIKTSHRERRDTAAVRNVGPGSCAKQKLCRFEIIAIDSPVKRCCAVDLRRVHIGFLLQERTNGCRVASHHGIRNVASTCGKARADYTYQKTQRTSEERPVTHRCRMI